MSDHKLARDLDLNRQPDAISEEFHLGEAVAALRAHSRLLGIVLIASAAVTYGVTLLIPPTFTARTTIISPQQQQNSAAAALASLGSLAGLAGAGGMLKSPADQYVSLLQSTTVSNRLIDRFKLMDLYEAKFRVDAQKQLQKSVRISVGKKDNLITIEVDDTSAARASEIANGHVDELRWVTNTLALTEAQQRRKFFEQQMLQTKDALKAAQLDVQRAGFTAGALKSEPKSAAEAYARTRAEIAGAEIRLSTLSRTLTENAPEIQQQKAALSALRSQLAQFERPLENNSSQDYVSAYREFKYQEAIFDVFAKQFELAKMDEAREGTLIQVLDPATPPERKSKPARSMITASIAMASVLFALSVLVIRRRRHLANA